MSSGPVHDSPDAVLKVIRKMDTLTGGELGVRIEALYETKMDIDYKLNVLKDAPISSRAKENLYKKAEETGKYINDLLKVIAAYGISVGRKNQNEHGNYGVEPTNPGNRDAMSNASYKNKRLNKEQLEGEIQKYKKTIDVLAKKIVVNESQLERELGGYKEFYKSAKPLNEKMTRAEKTVIAGLMAAFALPILYFFSQTSPDNLVVGNFVAGDGTPTLMIMMTSVVVFVMFFLTHHKLK